MSDYNFHKLNLEAFEAYISDKAVLLDCWCDSRKEWLPYSNMVPPRFGQENYRISKPPEPPASDFDAVGHYWPDKELFVVGKPDYGDGGFAYRTALKCTVKFTFNRGAQ